MGIDPEEMRENKPKLKKAPKDGPVYEKRNKRGEVLSAMIDKARTQPNFKIINRLIKVIKQVFQDKTDQGKEDENVK